MVPLKACPFCGGAAVYSRIPGGGFSVLCRRCGAIAAPAACPAAEDAGRAWNRREQRPNFSRAADIKPCPFCASRASIARLANDASILKCQNCGVMISFAQSDGLPATLARWNMRSG